MGYIVYVVCVRERINLIVIYLKRNANAECYTKMEISSLEMANGVICIIPNVALSLFLPSFVIAVD